MDNNLEMISILSNAPAEGFSEAELEKLNEMGSEFLSDLGLRFIEASPECVRAEMQVQQNHLQITGVVNGGIYCLIAETVGSILGLIAARGGVALGVNNNTDFLSSVSAGIIVAEARPIHAGKRNQLISIEMRHKDKLVARSTLRTVVMPAPPTENPGRREDKFVIGGQR